MTDRTMVPMKDLIRSISMGPFGSDVKVEYMCESGVPIIDGSNLTSIKMNWDNYRFFDADRANKLQPAITRKGDIVITHRGTLGQLSYVPEDSPFDAFLISQSQFRVTLDTEKVNPIYFAYYFHTDEGQKRLLSFANYVGVPALASATTNFRELEFPLIPINEQNKIAKLLEEIDEKIENNKDICLSLESMAKLIYDYWFIQFEFPDKNGKPYKTSAGKMVYNDVLKREIPDGWRVFNIEDLALPVWGQCPDGGNIINKTTKADNVMPYCSGAGDMDGGYIVDCQANTNASRREVEKGAILISVAGTIGKMAIADKKISLGRATLGLIPKKQEYGVLIWFILKTFNDRLKMTSVGAVQKIINKSNLKEINIALPEELPDISVLDNLMSLMYELSIENRRLGALRDWLLPLLVSGYAKIKN